MKGGKILSSIAKRKTKLDIYDASKPRETKQILDTNQAGALVSESDTFYVTPVNTRFAINIMELKTW